MTNNKQTTSPPYLVQWHQLLNHHFNEEELKTLAFELTITYDDLPANGRQNKARELISLLDRHHRLAELRDLVARQRPTLPLPPLNADEEPTDPDPTFPLINIPFRRNPNFTGRTQALQQIETHLQKKRSTIPVHIITGMGGMGKTQTAVTYAHQHLNDYDLIWWLRAETEETLTASYFELVQALNLRIKTGAEQQVYVNLVNHWLKQTKHTWLLIFDNAETPNRLPTLIPRHGSGAILVTSRNPAWQHLGRVTPLNPLSPTEAQDLLLNSTSQTDTAAASHIADLLGHLPLALTQASAYINQRRLPLATYADYYQNQQQKLWQRQPAPTDYHSTITTTWQLALQQLQESTPAAASLLNLCTFLHPDNIPLSLLQQGQATLPPDLATLLNDPLDLEDALAFLLQYALIERQDHSLSLHRVLQDVTRHHLDPVQQKTWATIAVSLIQAIFSFDYYKLETWAASAPLLPHLFSVTQHAQTHQVALDIVASLYQQAGDYLRRQGDYPAAQNSIEQALNLRRHLFDDEHPDTAQSLDYLGELAQEQANYPQAHQYHQTALHIRQTSLGDNHPDTTLSLNNMGSLLQDQGAYEETQPYYQQALTIRQQILGHNHPHTADSLNNMGSLLRDQGAYEAAQPYYQQALTIRQQVLGDNHPDTASSLNNMGSLLRDQGDYEAAQPYYQQALTIRQQVLGHNHPDTAGSLNNMGTLLRDQGAYEAAQPYLQQALTIFQQVLGDNHPDTAFSLNNMGGLLLLGGKYAAARPYLEKAVRIYEKIHGRKHPHLVTLYSNLGTIYIAQKQHSLARRYLSRAAAICRETEEQYAECQKVGQLLQALPGGLINRRKKKAKGGQKKKRHR